jgi:hypothetical protein
MRVTEVEFEFIYLARSEAKAQEAASRLSDAGFSGRVARGDGEGTLWQVRIVVERTVARSLAESSALFEARIDDEYGRIEENLLALVPDLHLAPEGVGITCEEET